MVTFVDIYLLSCNTAPNPLRELFKLISEVSHLSYLVLYSSQDEILWLFYYIKESIFKIDTSFPPMTRMLWFWRTTAANLTLLL